MFGFFKSKKKKISVSSRWAITRQGAIADLLRTITPAKKPVFIFYFFEESRDLLKIFLSTEYISFKEVNAEPAAYESDIYFVNAFSFDPKAFNFKTAKTLYCLDHYPLHTIFHEFKKKLEERPENPELVIYGGLDEPLLSAFGGERIMELMQRIGLRESEIVEHEMINDAIENAQKKIELKVPAEIKARSASEWFRINYAQPI